MSTTKKVLVFTATYNDSRISIHLLVNKKTKTADLLIIDDGSPDGTASKIQKLQKFTTIFF